MRSVPRDMPSRNSRSTRRVLVNAATAANDKTAKTPDKQSELKLKRLPIYLVVFGLAQYVSRCDCRALSELFSLRDCLTACSNWPSLWMLSTHKTRYSSCSSRALRLVSWLFGLSIVLTPSTQGFQRPPLDICRRSEERNQRLYQP